MRRHFNRSATTAFGALLVGAALIAGLLHSSSTSAVHAGDENSARVIFEASSQNALPDVTVEFVGTAGEIVAHGFQQATGESVVLTVHDLADYSGVELVGLGVDNSGVVTSEGCGDAQFLFGFTGFSSVTVTETDSPVTITNLTLVNFGGVGENCTVSGAVVEVTLAPIE